MLPLFTKAHYLRLCKVIQTMPDELTRVAVANILARMFEEDNPRFNRRLFFNSAGVEDNIHLIGEKGLNE